MLAINKIGLIHSDSWSLESGAEPISSFVNT